MIQTFENRFDISYLRLLSELLEISNLKKSAVTVRKDKRKKYYDEKSKKKVLLEKAIKIDFSGIACTTLLGTSTPEEEEEQEEDIKRVYAENAEEIINLKKEIVTKFKNLISKRTIDKLNKAGIYVQIRLVFPYLYSDFPITLMRCEDSNIWDTTIDHDISFTGNAPMDYTEWKNSNLYTSQIASLHQIASLCEHNDSLCRIKDYDDATNTLETRFSVIPIQTCVLLLNDVAITDSYIYAKVGHEDHLAFNTPVVVIDDFKDKKQRKKVEEMGFKMLKKNFLYVWRHDLTMYAHMATEFREDKPFGLKVIVPPIVPGTEDSPNIKWQEKVDRIISRKKRSDKNYNHENELDKIKDWIDNVEQKMELNTRKIIPIVIDPLKLSIKICKPKLTFIVEIIYDDQPLFAMDKLASNTLFCLLAHFALARKTSQKPSMHKLCKSRTKLRTEAKLIMGKKDRIKEVDHKDFDGIKITANILFHALFGPANRSGWIFLIPPDQITIENAYRIQKAKYKTGWTEKDKKQYPEKNIETTRGCFEGLRLDPYVEGKDDSVITFIK